MMTKTGPFQVRPIWDMICINPGAAYSGREAAVADLDLLLFRMINGMAGTLPLWDAFNMIMAEASPGVVLLVVVLLWAVPGPHKNVRRRLTVLVVLAVFLAIGVSATPGGIYYRLRPYMDHEVNLLVAPLPSPSFPSTHSAGMAAAAPGLAAYSRLLGSAAYVLLALMMYARVYTGSHYPSDVLFGALLGWICGLLIRQSRESLHDFADRIAALFGEILRI